MTKAICLISHLLPKPSLPRANASIGVCCGRRWAFLQQRSLFSRSFQTNTLSTRDSLVNRIVEKKIDPEGINQVINSYGVGVLRGIIPEKIEFKHFEPIRAKMHSYLYPILREEFKRMVFPSYQAAFKGMSENELEILVSKIEKVEGEYSEVLGRPFRITDFVKYYQIELEANKELKWDEIRKALIQKTKDLGKSGEFFKAIDLGSHASC